MFQRVGKNAWETHFSWSMEVGVYIFCCLRVKCYTNEGFYLIIYCCILPDFLWIVKKCIFQKSGSTAKKKALKSTGRALALWLGFLLGAADHFHGWKQRKKPKVSQQERKGAGDVFFLLRRYMGMMLSCFKTLLWCPKLAGSWTKECVWY